VRVPLIAAVVGTLGQGHRLVQNRSPMTERRSLRFDFSRQNLLPLVLFVLRSPGTCATTS
jgi:hypothetical protein